MMHSFLGTVLCFASTLGFVISAPLDASLPTPTPPCIVASTTPVKPTEDCFYREPENIDWKASKPGTVLKFRRATVPALPEYQAYNILYRTTDSHNKSTYAVTTVFAPGNGSISNPHALISYQHNYNSADLDKSPSFCIGDPITDSPAPVPLHVCMEFVKTYLKRGWFVNVPDYEGPTAAFGAGLMSGYATLDSIRAAMSRIYRMGMPKHYPIPPKILMYGYSGGSIATNWAAVLHPSYASELKIAGAGVGGFFPDIPKTIPRLHGLYVRDLIRGLATMHEQARKPVCDFLNKTWEDAMIELGSMNTTYAATMVEALLNDTEILKVLNNDVDFRGKGVPTIPMIFHRAQNDSYSTDDEARALWQVYRDKKAVVYLHIENDISNVFGPNAAHALEMVAPNGNEEVLRLVANSGYDLSGNNSVPLMLNDMLHRWQFPNRSIDVTESWSYGRYGKKPDAWKPGESKPQKPHHGA